MYPEFIKTKIAKQRRGFAEKDISAWRVFVLAEMARLNIRPDESLSDLEYAIWSEMRGLAGIDPRERR